MNACLISEQNPMPVQLLTALHQVLKIRSKGRTRVVSHKYGEFAKIECPTDVEVIVIDVDVNLVRAAILKIRESVPEMPILCVLPKDAHGLLDSLQSIGATATLMVAPHMVEKSMERYIAFFDEHVPQFAEELVEAA